MSFLAEVLSLAEKVELNEINSKVPELTTIVENAKREAHQYLDNIHIKYSQKSVQVENELLLKNALKVQDNLTELKKNADLYAERELVKSSEEMKRCVEQLDDLNCTLSIVLTLLNINVELSSFNEQLEAKSYLQCIKTIANLENMIAASNEAVELEYIYNEFKLNVRTQKNILRTELRNIFESNVSLSNKDNSVQLIIRKNNIEMQEALQAMFSSNEQVFVLHSLAKALWNNIFIPVVDSVTELEISEEGKTANLVLKTVDDSKKAPYGDVFHKLKEILKFLTKNFNVLLNDDTTTMKYIGNDIRDNLSELIIKHCLQETIPSSEEELQKYKVVIDETKQLEAALIESNLFDAGESPLLDYAKDVDVHFINKKCKEYLLKSENIMKKDLHNMVEVGSPGESNNPLQSDIDTFALCSVSKNVLELLQYTESILQKALNASDVCAGRSFCTVQNIFMKYGTYIPEYHKKLLQTIPQQVALFYNNCNFIAHTLMTWNKTYCCKLGHTLGSCSFTAEITFLHNTASDQFETCVENQVKQIKEIMKDAALEGATIEKVQPSTEKCVRQCLRQMELLKTVWSKVLSYKVYNKAMGIIISTLTIHLIDTIVKFEDISAEAAEQFVDIIKLLLTRGPKLFTDSREITIFVPSWYKLTELNFILSSTLLDINDRWAAGKGPLALQFTALDLKQLIRALFQNTDRRAAILAKLDKSL